MWRQVVVNKQLLLPIQATPTRQKLATSYSIDCASARFLRRVTSLGGRVQFISFANRIFYGDQCAEVAVVVVVVVGTWLVIYDVESLSSLSRPTSITPAVTDVITPLKRRLFLTFLKFYYHLDNNTSRYTDVTSDSHPSQKRHVYLKCFKTSSPSVTDLPPLKGFTLLPLVILDVMTSSSVQQLLLLSFVPVGSTLIATWSRCLWRCEWRSTCQWLVGRYSSYKHPAIYKLAAACNRRSSHRIWTPISWIY